MKPSRNLQNLIEAKDMRLNNYLSDIETAVLALERAAQKLRKVLEEDDGEIVPSRVYDAVDRIDVEIEYLKKDHSR
jgi:hypothetical protein